MGKELHNQTREISHDTFGVYFFMAGVLILPIVKCLTADIKTLSPIFMKSLCYIQLTFITYLLPVSGASY